MDRIKIDLPENPYEVLLGENILYELNDEIQKLDFWCRLYGAKVIVKFCIQLIVCMSRNAKTYRVQLLIPIIYINITEHLCPQKS